MAARQDLSQPIWVDDEDDDESKKHRRRPIDSSKDTYPSEYEGHFDSILLSSSDIEERTMDLAKLIREDYKGTRPILVCALKGAVPFYSELCRALSKLRQGYDTEYLRLSSYEGTQSTGNVKISGDLSWCKSDRHVLIVEDIVDTGTTLSHVVPHLQQHGNPLSVETVALLDKRLPKPKLYQAKYVGFSIPDHFVIGFGLDYNELYRDLQAIYTISQKGIECDSSKLQMSSGS